MIDAWLDVVLAAKEYPGDAELQAKAAEFRSCIKSAKRPDAEFSSMAMDYLSGREL